MEKHRYKDNSRWDTLCLHVLVFLLFQTLKFHCIGGTGTSDHYIYNPLTDAFMTAISAAPFTGLGLTFRYQGKDYLVQGTDYYELTTADDAISLTWAAANTYDVNLGTDGGWSIVFAGYVPTAEAPEALADLDTFDLTPPNAQAMEELDWLTSYE